jgi:hypothetical protein
MQHSRHRHLFVATKIVVAGYGLHNTHGVVDIRFVDVLSTLTGVAQVSKSNCL